MAILLGTLLIGLLVYAKMRPWFDAALPACGSDIRRALSSRNVLFVLVFIGVAVLFYVVPADPVAFAFFLTSDPLGHVGLVMAVSTVMALALLRAQISAAARQSAARSRCWPAAISRHRAPFTARRLLRSAARLFPPAEPSEPSRDAAYPALARA
jgi:hypothetical protein